MEYAVTIRFDGDPRRSAHVDLALGPGWARVVLYGGPQRPSHWDSLTSDAARAIGAVLGQRALENAVLHGATACADTPTAARGAWEAAVARQAATLIVGEPSSKELPNEEPPAPELPSEGPPPPDPSLSPFGAPFPDAYDPEPTADAVFRKIATSSRQHGSHPDFKSGDLRTVFKLNNYIISVFGTPLSSATLEGVRRRLATSGL